MNFFTNKKLIVLILISTFILASAIDFVGFKNSSIENNKTTGMIFVNGFEPDLIFANGFESSDFIFANGFDGANIAPIANDDSYNTLEDTGVEITLTATDGNNDALSYLVVTNPVNGVLSGTPPDLTYNPNLDFNGTDQFEFIANDGQADSQRGLIQIVVNPVNDAPIAIDQNLTHDEDTLLSITLTAQDVEGGSLTYSIVDSPLNGALSGTMPNLVYTPTLNYFGNDSFTFKANDTAIDSNTATISLTINPINDQPVAHELNVSTPYQTSVVLNLTGDDIEDVNLTFAIQDQPSHGTISENAGVYSYLPEDGYSGPDQASYHAIDSLGLSSDDATITITVEDNNNQPPEIISTPPLSAMVNVDIQYDAEATDPEGDNLTFSLLSSPEVATQDPSSGLISWPPSVDYSSGISQQNNFCKVSSTTNSPAQKLQFIAVVDSSGSMKEEQEFLGLWMPQLSGQMLGVGIGETQSIDYGITVFGNTFRLLELMNGELFSDIAIFTNSIFPIDKININLGGSERGIKAIIGALDGYPFINQSSRSILLMTDEPCSGCSAVQTEALQQRLLDENVILHSMVPSITIKCPDNTIALGIDNNNIGYVADGQGHYYSCLNASYVTSINIAENYVETALLSHGSVWGIGFLESDELTRSSFAQATAEVIADIVETQISITDNADLFIDSSSIINSNNTLQITVGNRGLLESTEFSVKLFDQNVEVDSASFLSLPVEQTEVLEFDISSYEINSLSLVIQPQQPENECSTDNNTLKFAYFNFAVNDGNGGQDSQSFNLQVSEENVTPILAPIANLQIPAGTKFESTIIATDANKGDAMVFNLTQGLDIASINQYSGVFSWTPTADFIGTTQDFLVNVTDLSGLTDNITFSIEVITGLDTLRITSHPPQRAIIDTNYNYPVQVESDASAVLSFELLSFPENMTISALGEINWQVPVELLDQAFTIILRVSDQFGNRKTQAYLLVVDEADQAPVITSTVDFVTTLHDDFIYQGKFADINALESFVPEIIKAPPDLHLFRYDAPFSDFNYNDVTTLQLDRSPTTRDPQYKFNSNHWCGVEGSSSWVNLAPQLVKRHVINPHHNHNDTLATNILVTSLQDTNLDGITNQQDDQYIIYAKDFGVAAMNAKTLVELWFQPNVRVVAGIFSHALAAADLDGDGTKEILVLGLDGHLNTLNALSHTGEILWTTLESSHFSSATKTLVFTDDLDADGDLEIMAGTNVFDHQGNLIFSFGDLNFLTYSTHIATGDINNDGLKELIYNDKVYTHDGTVLYDNLGEGNYYAIANFDEDAGLEWVQVNVQANTVSLFDDNATLLWERQIQTATKPSVADVDLDGQLDIVMTHAMIEADGTITRDKLGNNSHHSILTDLNLDGAYELITGNGQINVVDAITGDLIFIWKAIFGRSNFVIADRFGLGEYEIVFSHFVRNNLNYIDFIKASDGQWKGGAGEVTQAKYDRGLTVNGEENRSSGLWLEQMVENNLQSDIQLSSPDLEEIVGEYKLSTEVRNITPSTYQGELQVDFYTSDASNTLTLLGSTSVNDLGPNEKKTIYYSGTIDAESFTETSFVVEVTPVIPINECKTTNNKASSEFVYWQVTDSAGLSDKQAYTVKIKHRDLGVTSLSPLSSATAWQSYTAFIEPNNYLEGDDVFFFIIDKPTGMEITSKGLITWLPTENQVGVHAIQMVVQDDGGNAKPHSLNITVSESNNQAPYITSTPTSTITEGGVFQYQVIAIDPEGETLSYSLLESPIGASINQNGLLNWDVQNNNQEPLVFNIKVEDTGNAFDTQKFEIQVATNNNSAPIITSTPTFSIVNGDLYSYQVLASDPENDPITYSLTSAPLGMTVDLNTGLLEWNTTKLGEYEVAIKVSDDNNLWTLQQYTLYVIDTPNTAPIITSEPTTQHPLGLGLYSYQVIATDADDDTLSFQLITAPIGVLIDELTGLVTWPAIDQISGTHEIIVEVIDNRGGWFRQTYQLTIGTGNNAPIITSIPLYTALVNRLYQYPLLAEDADTPILQYSIISGPIDMLIDNNGLISWTPSAVGVVDIVAQVSDGTSYVNQSWQITIHENSSNLDARIVLTPLAVSAGENVNLRVDFFNSIGSVDIVVEFAGSTIPLDANYEAQISSPVLGTHEVIATVTDDFETVTTISAFSVGDPLDLQAPIIDIITPPDGSIITGLNDISISVQDDNIFSWRLHYRNTIEDVLNSPSILLVDGSSNVDSSVVTQWDTSQLRNGVYILILEATDLSGNITNVSHSIFLEGDLKIGHFQIAFEDLTIPVAGIPVTITRSYDTRNRNSDEAFGKGWEIGYQSLQLSESRIPGLGWYQTTEFYNIGPVRLPRFCIESIGERLVSIRLPDDTLEKYLVKAKTLNPTSDERGNCQDILPPEAFTVEFLPQGDTNSQLRAEGDVASYVVRNGNVEPLADEEIYDPNKYTLTLLDGTIYSIDQGFNLTDIETTDGNSIHFTHDGIEHNNGYSVVFIRDAQERIISIQKPNGDSIDYTYDSNGDLESHTDLMGNTTIFTYILDHYLEDIIDPRGIMVARNEYDAEGRLIAHIDADGNRIEYTHDIAGRTETIKDRNGNSSVFVYDNAGSVIAESNPLGETTFHEYNDIRLETKRIDPLGNETTWTYDNFGNQLTETDVLGNTTTSTYTNRGEIITQTDANGDVIITNEYSDQSNPFAGSGNITKVTNALGHVTEYTWSAGQASNQDTVVFSTGFKDARGNKFEISSISSGTSTGLSGSTTDLNGLKIETAYDDVSTPTEFKQIVTDVNGNTVQEITTSFEYNANSDVIKTTDDLGNITLTEYDQLKRVSATVDANGNRTEFTFDDLGNAIKTTHADGTTELATYDAEGNQLTSTDRAGRVTKTIYDVLNRPIETILPDATPNDDSDNPRGITAYNAIGQMISITDPLGNITQYEYDALGKRTKTIDALGNTTTVAFDSNGIITQKTDALGRITKYETNAIGSIVKTIFPDNTPNDDSDNLFTTKTQDELMLKTSETDLAGKSTQYEYSDGSNLTAVIDPMAQRTEYTYDQRGNKLTQTDANGNTTTWAYDELSRMVSTTLPDGQTKSKTYDAVGNTITKTDFNGDLTTYVHNNLNQLVTTTFADTTTVTSTYTDTGKIASITQTQGITIYQYDAQDRLTRIDYPDNNFIAYGYNLNGNRTQLQTASQTVNYTFDVLNRLATATDSNGTTSYSYDAVGNRASQTNANGTIATYSYDPLNRLTNLVHTDASSNVIASYQYTLGANGNRQRIEEATGRVIDYSYDDLYRLITEDIIDPVNGNHSTEFAYDFVGNRLQQTKDSITTTYLYNNNDLLLTETENTTITSYTYDNNGNTLTKSIDGTLDTEYSYNKENQMIQATTSTSTIVYDYDASGIKYYQNVDGTITNFLIDPNRSYAQVIEEQDSSNNAQVIYLYGDDLITQTRTGSTHTFGYDGLGSTRILTDTNGTVQNSYGYQAFGEQDYQFGTIENSYLFTGEQYDNNIGFYYLRARYYNPSNGRFTQMDTFPGMQFEPRTLHKYLYTANNPINLIDPSGNTFFGGLAAAGRVFGVLAAYGIAAYNVIERVENGIAIYQGVSGLYAAWNKMQAAGLSFNIEGDSEFNEAMQNWDTALYVLSKNMGRIFHDMAGNKKKRDEVQQFVNGAKNKLNVPIMLIYGPTPHQDSPWFDINTRVRLGKLSIGKKKRKIMLELGRKSKSGGRMVGMGHTFTKAKDENTQWWRMDYHGDHGAGSNDWSDDGYHFHTLTAGNKK